MKRMRLYKIALGCCVAVLPYLTLGASESLEQRAFYAISSLQSHLQTVLENSRPEACARTAICDDKDVSHLWQIAAHSPFTSEVSKAEALYYKSFRKSPIAKVRLLNKAKERLHRIWKRTNRAIKDVALSKAEGSQDRFLLPSDHRLKRILDTIFNKGSPLQNRTSFLSAGFELVCQRSSSMMVARNAMLPGYLVKAYVNEEKNNSHRNRCWMENRCLGAENVRNLIAEKKLKFFTVPDKWIYILPGFDALNDRNNALLVVSDMRLTSDEKTKWAWKNIITKRHLDELHCILSHGFASTYLIGNIPYTKEGNFTCIDTEYPERVLPLHKVSSYLSDEMRPYWEKLIRTAKGL